MAEIEGPEHTKFVCLKLQFLKSPIDNVQYNTEHHGMHDDADDECLGVAETVRRSRSSLY